MKKKSSKKKIVPTLAEFGSSSPLGSYPAGVALVGTRGAAEAAALPTALGRLTA